MSGMTRFFFFSYVQRVWVAEMKGKIIQSSHITRNKLYSFHISKVTSKSSEITGNTSENNETCAHGDDDGHDQPGRKRRTQTQYWRRKKSKAFLQEILQVVSVFVAHKRNKHRPVILNSVFFVTSGNPMASSTSTLSTAYLQAQQSICEPDKNTLSIVLLVRMTLKTTMLMILINCTLHLQLEHDWIYCTVYI